MNPMAAVASGTALSAGAAPSHKLVKAAQDFEAILLSSWLEKLQKSFAGTDDGSDPAHDTLASLGTQAIAAALAARGGIGVAKLILQHFAKTTDNVGGSESRPEKRNFGTAKVPQNIADRSR